MLSFLLGVGVGLVGAVITGFLVWRNNKSKFQNIALKINGFVGKYDSKEELEAALEELLADLNKK